MLAAALLLVRVAAADPITGLSFDVVHDGTVIGDVRLHVGTHNFQPTGRDGRGRATPTGEQSGFRPPEGLTLGDVFPLAGVEHLNWLQIVTAQPAAHNAPFGPPPHADPSDDPDNTTPHDLAPWYLNEVIPTNPPFDLPPATAGLLEFQDFPAASPWVLDEAFSADVYLVGIVDSAARTYTTLASFSWTLVNSRVGGETRVRMTELEAGDPALSHTFQRVVSSYAGQGWTYVPEPASAWGLLMVLVVRPRRGGVRATN